MKPPVSGFCVYTIAQTSKLKEKEKENGGKGNLTEHKNWATARKLLLEAKAKGEAMFIVFAPAEDTRELIFWARLDDIRIQSVEKQTTTTYDFSGLTAFPKPVPKKKSLVLRSSGRNISASFIRPYAICKTPKFLLDRLKQKH